jgi:CHAT domain-containing protein
LCKQGFKLENFKKLIIVPHGMLHNIPFAALLGPNGRYLIEQVALTTVPSAYTLFTILDHKRSAVETFVGFSSPVLLNHSYPPLHEAEKEVERISKILRQLKVDIYNKENANEENFRKYAIDKNIIHLATHGEFPEENALELHRILLAPTSMHDGRINAEEIRRMDLSSVRLSVLSICNGGLYRFGPGDEPYGLISSLLSCGVENVLSTLWSVEDEIGRHFMIEYYKHVLALGPAEALRKASMTFIQANALIRQWASFVLVGPGRNIYYEPVNS